MRTSQQQLRLGAGFLIAGAGMFAVMNVFAKLASEHVSLAQIMFFRNFGALLPVSLIVASSGGWSALRTPHPQRHLLRAITQLGSMVTGFYGLSVLPLAEATAINYAAPIFVSILAVPFLGERPGVWRWISVGLGFGGVLAIANGRGGLGSDAMPVLGLLGSLGNAIFSAAVTIQVRKLAAVDKPATIVAWQAMLMTVICACALPFVWITPSWQVLCILLAVGFCGGVAQYMTTQAYARAEASAVGPYGYSGILFGMILGWVWWGDTPTIGMLLGGLLIAFAGFLILHTESRRKPKEET